MQREVEVTSDVHIVWGLMDGFLLYWDQVYVHLAAILLHSPSMADNKFFLVCRRLLIH